MLRSWFAAKLLIVALGFALVYPAAAGALEGVEIVAWTGYVGELEWANLRDPLEGAGATIVETETRDPDELSGLLEGVEFLLLPEQADAWLWEDDLEPYGQDLAPALRAFLGRGGRIVALTWAVGGEDILRGAGLTTAEDSLDVSAQRLVVVAPGHPLVQDVPEEFIAPEFSTDFWMVDPDAVDIVATQDDTPVVFILQREGGEIVLLGFDFLEVVEASEQLVINAFLPDVEPPVEPPLVTFVVPGELLEGKLAPGERWEEPEKQLGLNIDPHDQYVLLQLEGNLDLHLRRDEPVEFGDGPAAADLSLLGPGGHLALLSVDMLDSDIVVLALANPTDDDQDYRLVAWIVPDLEEIDTFPFDTTGELGPMPVEALDRFVETEEGHLALVQYKIAIADGHEHLNLSVAGENIRAYIRHGEPVTLVGGTVQADLVFTDHVAISGPFLVPGVYYIAIEGLTPPQTYDIEGDLR